MIPTAKSESDMTSLAPSSPSRPVYFVQSPSRDSHDGDAYKSSSMQPSPMDSPSHDSSSVGRHSRNSSASRFSGIFRSSSGRKGGGRKGRSNEKGWPECEVIMEEGSYDDRDKAFTRRFQALLAILTFVALFTLFCLIIWGAARPFKAQITVKRMEVHNFYIGEGTDNSGVPTKMLTLNCSLKLGIYNPATIFGIHVTSSPITLIYSKIPIATGQLKKYYQPRKSRRTVTVAVEGRKVPLYGAGSSIEAIGKVGVQLMFEIRTRGNVVGKLVKTKHRKWIVCPLTIDATSTKPIKFNKDSCTYS